LKRILFIVPYPVGISPGQRFRFEQYINYLKSENYEVEVAPFFVAQSIVKKGGLLLLAKLFAGMCRRLLLLFRVNRADFVFIFREATPFGPPIIEWIIAKVFQKKVIYDFDDAIWLTDNLHEAWIERKLRWRSKVSSICKWSYKVSAGNEYLATYARQFNNNVVVNPTTVDAENVHHPSLHSKSPADSVIIGWTGSNSTLKYLNEVERVIQQLEKKYSNLDFWVIADKPPHFKIDRLHFKPWSVQTEVSDLLQVDIGIMPLPDDDWSKGKCGFKILQYMALEIPSVASPVGVNATIIQNGVNGYLAQSENEWVEKLEELISDAALRRKMGTEGRVTVEKRFSVASNKLNFISLFR
jgi:glycosyltransferase involved in cell wall biosynthesis